MSLLCPIQSLCSLYRYSLVFLHSFGNKIESLRDGYPTKQGEPIGVTGDHVTRIAGNIILDSMEELLE